MTILNDVELITVGAMFTEFQENNVIIPLANQNTS